MKQGLRRQEFNAREVRELIRNNEYGGTTSGLASGFAQANLVILPGEYAFDFLKFCMRNPKPCPILESPRPETPRPWSRPATRTFEPTFPAIASTRTAGWSRSPRLSNTFRGTTWLLSSSGAASRSRRRCSPRACGLRTWTRTETSPCVRHGQGLRTLGPLCRTYGGEHASLPRR